MRIVIIKPVFQIRPALFRTVLGLLAGSLLAVSVAGHAASVTVAITDRNDAPLDNVVVYAEALSGEVRLKATQTAEIAQINRKFVPLVTVVQVGTEISFPNYDSVRHHVYSFSPVKTFDLPLYAGKAARSQLFDKAGTVVLGCNIHDKMIAYVQVVNTPHFGRSDAAGRVRLDGLNPGKYLLKAWYYGLPLADQVVVQNMTLGESDLEAAFKLNAKKKVADSPTGSN